MADRKEKEMDEYKRLEEMVLEEIVRAGEKVTIFLLNGYQAKAEILDFDCETILAKVNGQKWLIYRQAVSTIAL